VRPFASKEENIPLSVLLLDSNGPPLVGIPMQGSRWETLFVCRGQSSLLLHRFQGEPHLVSCLPANKPKNLFLRRRSRMLHVKSARDLQYKWSKLGLRARSGFYGYLSLFYRPPYCSSVISHLLGHRYCDTRCHFVIHFFHKTRRQTCADSRIRLFCICKFPLPFSLLRLTAGDQKKQ
jgi:hypothetical protein